MVARLVRDQEVPGSTPGCPITVREDIMLWPGIKKLGKELNLKRSDSEVTGIIKNCFVRMYDGNQIKVLELFVPQMDDDDKNYIVKKLESCGIKKYEWRSNGVKVVFQEYLTPYSTKKIKELLDEFVNYFGGKYPDQKPLCQYCGEQSETQIYCLDNIPLLICDNCYRQNLRTVQNDNAERQNAPNNYLSGFFGAVLFSVPGIFLTIIFFVFLERLAAVSAVVYVMLGIIGYKKFKGKVSRTGSLTVMAAALIMVGVGMFIAYSALIFKTVGEIDFYVLAYCFGLQDIQKEFLQNLIIAYVVSIAYFIFQFFNMFKEWGREKSVCKPREI